MSLQMDFCHRYITNRENNRVSRFGKALATWVERLGNLKDTDEVARDLAHLVRHTTSSSWEVIYLFNPEQRDFLAVGAFGLSPTLRRALVGKPLASTFLASIATMLRRRQQLIIPPDKAATFIGTSPWLERLTDITILSIPMVTRNQVTGAIIAGRHSQLP
ncbi:MAG TPA: GAF domain-containing protein, partial [Geobacterales bacterium]|nr:GAF domain-containing protein [Geobacterales bacterium]